MNIEPKLIEQKNLFKDSAQKNKIGHKKEKIVTKNKKLS